MQTTNTKSGFHALLIGINHYLPNELPSGLYYKSLHGCVQDVNRVETFLKQDLRIPPENITKLTSSAPVSNAEPPEPRSAWPTYENIVNAFKRIADVAQPGDQVFVHYSGHGGRAITSEAFKEIKGHDGVDEVLVPMDLGDSEGRYLRDTELQFLIQDMVKKKLYVTLVLDSCHAGGATRGLLEPDIGGAGVRGVGVIDTFKRPTESLVAAPEVLLDAWQAEPQQASRNVNVVGNWLLEPEGYVLLAACRANEYANEVVFEGHEKNGALSYWLVDSLKQVGPDFTYAMLHTRVLAKVHGQFAAQSPQLQGEGQRVVFDVSERLQPRSVPVISADGSGLISINAGLAHGVEKQAQFGIYPTNEADFTNTEKRVAIVEVTEVGPVNCEARIVDQVPATTIEAGYQAVRLEAGKIRLRGRVRVVAGEGQSKASIAALKAVDEALAAASGFATAATNAETPDYLLTIDEDEYVICDASGNRIPNLRPPLKFAESNAVKRVLNRLSHLVKYTNVRELDNNDSTSNISQKLVVELVSTPPDFRPGSPVKLQPLVNVGPTITVANGDWAFLRIRNNFEPHVLNVTVLDLQSDWGISQIYPGRAGSYESIDPGKEIILPLRVSLPEGYQSGTEIVKIFATLDTTSFRSLELPALDQPETQDRSSLVRPKNALETFLAAFESPQSTRAVAVDVCATTEWVAHQVEIEVVRKQDLAR